MRRISWHIDVIGIRRRYEVVSLLLGASAASCRRTDAAPTFASCGAASSRRHSPTCRLRLCHSCSPQWRRHGVDMSTPLLIEVAPEIDINLTSFYRRRLMGGGGSVRSASPPDPRYRLALRARHVCSPRLPWLSLTWAVRSRSPLAQINPLFQYFYAGGPCERARHWLYAYNRLCRPLDTSSWPPPLGITGLTGNRSEAGRKSCERERSGDRGLWK